MNIATIGRNAMKSLPGAAPVACANAGLISTGGSSLQAMRENERRCARAILENRLFYHGPLLRPQRGEGRNVGRQRAIAYRLAQFCGQGQIVEEIVDGVEAGAEDLVDPLQVV